LSKILIDPTMWDGPKFIDAPELACSLHVKALCYSANALTDGFVPASKARRLIKKASSREFQRALDHLTTVQPGCSNPSWEERPGGWFLHDYDDPQYANPLRAESQQRARTRQIAGKSGGLKSAQVRREKHGTAQPGRMVNAESPSSTLEANPEATSEPPFGGFASGGVIGSPKQTPKQASRTTSKLPSLPSTTTSTHGDKETSSQQRGDVHGVGNGQADTTSPQVQILRVLDWFMAKHGWSTWSDEETQKREAQRAIAIIELALPRDQLYARLEAMWDDTDPDDRPSSLGFFWTRLQDQAHAALKAPNSHARTEGPTQIKPVLPKSVKR
jgi:hypothetical protein